MKLRNVAVTTGCVLVFLVVLTRKSFQTCRVKITNYEFRNKILLAKYKQIAVQRLITAFDDNCREVKLFVQINVIVMKRDSSFCKCQRVMGTPINQLINKPMIYR